MTKKTAPANAEKKQDTRFKPGRSGNPKGKKPGTRHRATQMAEKLMQAQAQEVVQVVVDAALSGDLTAAKIIVERLVPVRKDRPLDAGAIRLPTLKADNLADAQAAVARALAGGRLTPSESDALTRVLEGHRKAVEITEMETRLENIEQKLEDLKNAKS